MCLTFPHCSVFKCAILPSWPACPTCPPISPTWDEGDLHSGHLAGHTDNHIYHASHIIWHMAGSTMSLVIESNNKITREREKYLGTAWWQIVCYSAGSDDRWWRSRDADYGIEVSCHLICSIRNHFGTRPEISESSSFPIQRPNFLITSNLGPNSKFGSVLSSCRIYSEHSGLSQMWHMASIVVKRWSCSIKHSYQAGVTSSLLFCLSNTFLCPSRLCHVHTDLISFLIVWDEHQRICCCQRTWKYSVWESRCCFERYTGNLDDTLLPRQIRRTTSLLKVQCLTFLVWQCTGCFF